MVVAGRFDKVRPHAGSEQFAQTIAGARFELIDAVHMMPAQAPAPLLALLEDFLGSLTGARAPTDERDAVTMKSQSQRHRHQLPGRRAGGRALAGPEQLARDQSFDVGRPGARARPHVPGAALRPARARRDRGAGRPLQLRSADRRRRGADGCALDQEGAFRRAVDGRRHRARPRRDSIRNGSTG